MAQNLTGEYRKFRYYEGVCSSADFVKELSKVLVFGVKSNPQMGLNGKMISMPYKIKNWDIVYPTVSKNFEGYENLKTRDLYFDEENGVESLNEDKRIEKLNNQIDQIEDMVILRTTTTPKDIEESDIDDLSVSKDSDTSTRSMYLQIWRPKYLANPEEYPLDAEMQGLIPQLITKEMYQEARKTTASVLYDLSLLKDSVNSENHRGLVQSYKKPEYVDAVSEAYSREALFDDEIGIFRKDTSNLFTIQEPGVSAVTDATKETSHRISRIEIDDGILSSIKQRNPELYAFLFNICGLRTTFTETEYDLIDNMKIMVTAVNDNPENPLQYYVTLSFMKEVEIFIIAGNADENPEHVEYNGTYALNVKNEYQHSSLTILAPELYSEGRYVPLPDKYLGDCDTENIQFNPEHPIKFCLDKVVDEEILYGTIVLRYSYEKENFKYTDIHSLNITDSVTLPNYHYCLMRIFDNPNIDFSGPEPNITDNKGNVTVTNSHTSPWSKLSWYQDFEEIMMDNIDEDVSVTNVTDGTLLVPLETAGLTADTRISYWINTNNDRFSLIVMGNPALDYERDRHLISTCYCGRIDSFENSINDVSGNFALYTSSSTTPCKTTMDSYTTQYPINRDFNNASFFNKNVNASDGSYTISINTENLEAYKEHSTLIGGCRAKTTLKNASPGFDIYYLTLTGNKFFNETQMPSYLLTDGNGNPINTSGDDLNPLYYQEVPYREFIYGSSDSRSNQIMIYLPNIAADPTVNVYFNFGYYEEKFVISSGITRDLFGNVVNIETDDSYGKNTSDGVTSVSMYHTRSKAFYQKHHFLFATTEEYMSKVMYGKSSYTGEYYADRIKITHGNDGPRGILCDTLVIDNSSLYPKDELVINKNFEKNKDELEETFTYFPITAPFSPLSDGPNARYGLALKKAEKEPTYEDNKKNLQIAKNQLDMIMVNHQIVNDDTFLPSITDNECKIYWSVVPQYNWIRDEDGVPIELHLADSTTKTQIGKYYEANNVEIVVDGFVEGSDTDSRPVAQTVTLSKMIPQTVAQHGENAITDTKTKDFKSYIHIEPSANITLDNTIKGILYGYSDSQIRMLNGNTVLTCIMDDGTDDLNNIHEYAFNDLFVDTYHPIEIPTYTSDNTEVNGISATDGLDQTLFNAHPSKYLNIFFVCDSNEAVATDNSNELPCYNKIIKSFISVPLHPTEWDIADPECFTTEEKSFFSILQYPCNVVAFTTGITNQNEQGIMYNSALEQRHEYFYTPYKQPLSITLRNMNGKGTLVPANHTVPTPEAGQQAINILPNASSMIVVPSSLMIDDSYISIARV